MFRSLKFCVLLALLAQASVPAHAKCPLIGYTVSGVISSEDARPIKAASVSIISLGEFFPQHPVVVMTDDAGEFKAQMRFDTYSGGSVSGDDCFRKPTRVSVAVQASGFNPANKQVPIGSDLKVIADLALVRSPQ
jgi:hypothetical protein